MSRSLGVSIARLHHLQHRYLHPLLRDVGLFRGQPPILMKTAAADGISQHELADRVHLRPPTVTRILARLEERGLVERRPEDDDQRVNRVYITDSGRETVSAVRAVQETEDREVFSVLTDEESRLLQSFLDRLARRYEEVLRRRDR